MKTGLAGKTALVGGSSKGLGKACAVQLAREGANVVICARGKNGLLAAGKEIKKTAITGTKVLQIEADLSKSRDVCKLVKKTFDAFGTIDVLIVNSGGPKPGRFQDLSKADWEYAFRSVLYYVIELYGLVIPKMKENKWGRIINIVSATVKEPAEDLILSNTFRAGVVSVAKTISKDLIAHNITINNLCPAAVRTDRALSLMAARAKKTGLTIDKVENEIVNGLPLKRFHKPEEIADLAVFLASERAAGITGTTIQVDGGLQKFVF